MYEALCSMIDEDPEAKQLWEQVKRVFTQGEASWRSAMLVSTALMLLFAMAGKSEEEARLVLVELLTPRPEEKETLH